MMTKTKIAVAGTGYVGMSLATLLAQHNSVVAVDIVPEKVDMINRGKSPIADKDIEGMLASGSLDLRATTDAKEAYADADYVVIAVPTNYDEKTNYFDTRHIEDVISLVESVNKRATMVIKSTIPIGYTERIRMQSSKTLGRKSRVIFCPEFLREGRALHDNLYPSRIIVGYDRSDRGLSKDAEAFALLLYTAAKKVGAPILYMGSTEAEAVKLFANSYLAMRVAYFNELDTFAEEMGLDSASIIQGISLDPRIGEGYNNPSFGYGGYCFPKDTKQLRANFERLPESLISAIVESNAKRKKHIVDMVALRALKDSEKGVVGVYRLAMKSGSDNFRESAVWDIMKELHRLGLRIVIYEPTLDSYDGYYHNYEVLNDLDTFKRECDVIIANRKAGELEDVAKKVYTRDIFNNN